MNYNTFNIGVIIETIKIIEMIKTITTIVIIKIKHRITI